MLQDSWGDQILPFDFTSGPLKGGATADAIYRTFVTGLDGHAMPSYQDAIERRIAGISCPTAWLMQGES